MKKLIIFASLCGFVMADLPVDFQKLFKIANQIRGSSYECQGVEVYAPYADFLASVEKDFNKAKLEPIVNYQQKLDYFKYWSFLSFSNFELYKDFFNTAQIACKNNLDHFIALIHNPQSAQELCSLYTQRFAQRAFGAIKPPYKKLDSRFFKFLSLQDNDAISFLSMSDFSELELEFILKIALLAHKDLSVINFLLQSGAMLDSGYESAIFYALDYPEGLKLLLANGADVNYTNSFNKTALIYAIERNDLNTVKTLLRFGARVDIAQNAPSAELPFYISSCAFKHVGKTPLMAAAASADVNMLKLLIAAGANVNALDASGLSANDYALIYEKSENAKFLNSLKEAK